MFYKHIERCLFERSKNKRLIHKFCIALANPTRVIYNIIKIDFGDDFMPFKIIRGDIAKTDAEAVVNAANTSLMPGSGVCGAIFAAAGYEKLDAACRKIGHCDTGKAVITKGFDLKAKYIIHTPGPIYRGGRHNEEALLYSCYRSSLDLAKRKRVKSIAFPLISSGVYGYPPKDALKVAERAISDFLENSEMDIYLVIYSKIGFEADPELISNIADYIDKILAENEEINRRRREVGESMQMDHAIFDTAQLSAPMPELKSNISERKPLHRPKQTSVPRDINEMLKNMDASFSEYLLQLIDISGMTDVQVYKRANIDRKLFSKIRGNRNYKPSKITAVALTLALGLDIDTARDLIGRAGYSLTHSSKFDIIIEYFILNKNYNIFEINEVLFSFDLPLIGA